MKSRRVARALEKLAKLPKRQLGRELQKGVGRADAKYQATQKQSEQPKRERERERERRSGMRPGERDEEEGSGHCTGSRVFRGVCGRRDFLERAVNVNRSARDGSK